MHNLLSDRATKTQCTFILCQKSEISPLCTRVGLVGGWIAVGVSEKDGRAGACVAETYQLGTLFFPIVKFFVRGWTTYLHIRIYLHNPKSETGAKGSLRHLSQESNCPISLQI